MSRYFIPSQQGTPSLPYQSEGDMLIEPVRELQINYFTNYRFQPLFGYGQSAEIMMEFRNYLVSFFDVKFNGFNWIQSLVNSKYFCLALHHRLYCNQRPDFESLFVNGLDTKRMKADLMGYLQFKGDRRRIMFIGDRWVCSDGSCVCERRRCDDPLIHQEWLSQIVDSFSSEYLIVYGNPAYLSIETHFYLMRNADIFVSAHGASFAASIFMYPPQRLFELTTKNSRHIADALGLQYYGYPLTDEHGELIPWYSDYAQPIVFNVEDVIHHIVMFLEGNITRLS